jgi:hypothetical protein
LRSAGAALGLCLLAGAALADPAGFIPPSSELASLVLAGQVEKHTPDSLWEKIDGEAESYRRFGLVSAALAYFEIPGNPDAGLEVSAFEMGDELGAFGVWATFRRPGDPVEALGNGGLRDDYQAALWSGRSFFLLHAFGSEAERSASLARGIDALLARVGASPPRPPFLSSFEEIADPSTVAYAPDHLLGRGVLPPGLEGRTREGLGVFASTSAPGAPPALAAYRALLGDARPVEEGGASGWAGTDPDLGPVVLLVSGSRLVGVRAAPDAPGAAGALARLLALPPR